MSLPGQISLLARATVKGTSISPTSIVLPGGGRITGTAGSITETASGTNQNITFLPSGTGLVRIGSGALSSGFSGYSGITLAGSSGSFIQTGRTGATAREWRFGVGLGSGNGDDLEIFDATNSVHGPRFVNTSNLNINMLLGGLTTNGTGLIQFLAATTAGGGISFGTDSPNANLYRNATSTIRTDANLNVGGIITGDVQALSGAGAVNVTSMHTDFTSTGGAQALTLANGAAGQTKTICHVVDGGSGVLTPTTKIGFSTITFTNVGDSVTLRYTASGWAIVGIFGATTA